MATIIEQSPPEIWDGGAQPAVHVHFSRWMLALLVVLLIGPWLAVAGFMMWPARAAHTEQSSAIAHDEVEGYVPGNPGPWGQLEYRSLRIELPDEFVFVPPPTHPPIRWFFSGYSKDSALEFLRSVGLGQGALEQLQSAEWKAEPGGVAIEPGDELILSLSPESRAKVYAKLVEMPENSRQIDPIWFRPGHVDDRLKDSGLADSSIELLKSLLYAQGENLLLFADFEPALRKLPDDAERRRFMKALSRKKTLLARLKLDADSDVEGLAAYWSVGGRRKDLLPLLSSLKREGEGTLSVLCLLPPFVRERLYNHPFTVTDPSDVKQDCFWSAMNFFSDLPDNRFNDMNYVREVLKRDYYNILEPSQLGDLVFLTTREETVIHAAAYIADDIVFTKNGASYTQPWLLMRHQDMIDTYEVRYPTTGPLKVLYFRRKTG